MYQPCPPKKPVRKLVLYVLLPVLLLGAWFAVPRINLTGEVAGIVTDSLDGVYVYNNGPVSATYGRNLSEDGYNIGLKYQCVEFVKRYYLEHYGHRMPDSYGHARDFFWKGLKSGKYNAQRGLNQFSNSSAPLPRKGDLVVFSPTILNRFGHVAIISKVTEDSVEIVQQNGGLRRNTRVVYPLIKDGEGYRINNRRIMGWLRMPE